MATLLLLLLLLRQPRKKCSLNLLRMLYPVLRSSSPRPRAITFSHLRT
jgi:hypothetical protein